MQSCLICLLFVFFISANFSSEWQGELWVPFLTVWYIVYVYNKVHIYSSIEHISHKHDYMNLMGVVPPLQVQYERISSSKS